MNLSIHPCRLLFSRPKTTASKPGNFLIKQLRRKNSICFNHLMAELAAGQLWEK